MFLGAEKFMYLFKKLSSRPLIFIENYDLKPLRGGFNGC